MHIAQLAININRCFNFTNRPLAQLLSAHAIGAEVWGSSPKPVKSAQCRQRLATAATFFRSCVAQALSSGDGPRQSLHASA